MARRTTEEERWHECFVWLARRRERHDLSEDGRFFVRTLQRGFAGAAGAAENRSAGHRGTNADVLCQALTKLLVRRGVAVHPSPATAPLAEQSKTVDLSFDHDGEWLVEIKFGLEFNSLAAAAMEGLLFKRARPKSKFILISMYSKFGSGGPPDEVAQGLLRYCGVAGAVGAIHVLSRRELNGGAWAQAFVAEVNRLCDELPRQRLRRGAPIRGSATEAVLPKPRGRRLRARARASSRSRPSR